MNDLIERYVEAAAAFVPERQRQDVRNEIRNAIDEMVEPRIDAGEREDAAVRATLESLGDPRGMAMRYVDNPPYLIGPGWFPLYMDVLKRLLPAAVAIVLVISSLAELIESDTSVGDAVLSGFGTAWGVGVAVLLWTTIGFVIAERTLGTFPGAGKDEPWSVDDLPELAVPRHIGLGETVGAVLVSLVFGILVIVQQNRGIGVFIRGDDHDWSDNSLINPDLSTGWTVAFLAVLTFSVIVPVIGYLGRTYNARYLAFTVIENIAWIVFIVALAISVPIFNQDLMQRLNGDDPERWLANSQANWGVALVFIAWSLWEIWDAWSSYRQHRTS